MGVFGDYLPRIGDQQFILGERKRQLGRIAQIRRRDVLVYAADWTKDGTPLTQMDYSDIISVSDQVSNLAGSSVDLILETPGGRGEVAEDIVKLLRGRFESVAVIVPGWAKSAGTLIAMAADDILMDASSALGPIDAQIGSRGKVISAHAMLTGFDEIKEEVERTGRLNPVYVPLLQDMTPGELQAAKNGQAFAQELVEEWLATYKFKGWTAHSSTGTEVTPQERQDRAKEIAAALADHGRWHSHGRSIHMEDLAKLRLRITDYRQQRDLADAITRYYALLRITFISDLVKLVETPTSHVYRHMPRQGGTVEGATTLDVKCNKCQTVVKVQANIGNPQPAQPGHVLFPADNKLTCPGCNTELDLSPLRMQIESSVGAGII